MSRPWIVVAAVSVAVAALLAHWPLRLLADGDALERFGFGAADLHGPAWHAHAPSAHWRGRELGAVDLRLQAWPLLIGQQRLQVQGAEFALTVVRGRRNGVLDATGNWPLDPGLGGTGQPSIQVAGFDALFSADRCMHVDGTVRLEVPQPIPGGGTPPVLSLVGTPRCDGDAFAVNLTGSGQPGGTHGPEADLRIRDDGHWRLDTRIPAADPALAAALASTGFQLADGRHSRVDTGFLFD
jgi:hypothetical protein